MNKSKSKQTKSQLHKNSTKKDKSNLDIPYSKPNKLKMHKSTRPFGKDITNSFHPNIPYPVLNPHMTNKLENSPLPQISNFPSKKMQNSPKRAIIKAIQSSSKMNNSTANTMKNSSELNSVKNENKLAKIPYDSNYIKNKIKSSFTQAKINNSSNNNINNNTNNKLNPILKSTMTNTSSFLKHLNNENVNTNNINNFGAKKQELLNRIKNKTSGLKYSITSKNYYINFYNNKNKSVKGFQLYEEPKIKNVSKKDDITKGIDIINKIDSQKIKGKLHKTTYNYYFNKNEGIKNTKSYDAKKIKKELVTKEKEKMHVIIEDKNKNTSNESIKENKNNIEKEVNDKVKEINKVQKKEEENNDNNNNKDSIHDKIDIKVTFKSDEKEKEIKEKENKINEKEIKEKEKEIKEKDINRSLSKEKKSEKDKKESNSKERKSHSKSKSKSKSKYKSPPRKSNPKKSKRNTKSNSSSNPIEINCKPLSKDNNKYQQESNNSKDEDDLAPKYFNTSSIKNVQIPKEYLNTIYYNLLKEQYTNKKKFKPEYNYMNSQTEINEQMRSILVDWIIDVHGKFGFTDETLYMTVLIIDRYSSIKKITRNEYQNLGISALMISCKHEEINVPKVEDFIYITDNAYNKEEVFKMEQDILNGLNYDLLYPSPIKFFEYLSLKFNFDKKQFFFGKYLMETFLLNLICIKYFPSIIACAAAYIVMKFFKLKNYKESYLKQWYMIEGKEGFNFIEPRCGVKDCAQEMCNFVDNIGSTNYLSCQKKYESEECCCISKLILNYAEKDDKDKSKN